MAESLPPMGRLRWLCRRGTRELDCILGGYLEADFEAAPEPMQRAFVRLLACQDPDIYDWLMNAATVDDPRLRDIIGALQLRYDLYPQA